jgi:hypothetical protein
MRLAIQFHHKHYWSPARKIGDIGTDHNLPPELRPEQLVRTQS